MKRRKSRVNKENADTGDQMRLGKVLVNLAIPMISKPENAVPGAILQ
jgi:hypothetical protein